MKEDTWIIQIVVPAYEGESLEREKLIDIHNDIYDLISTKYGFACSIVSYPATDEDE